MKFRFYFTLGYPTGTERGKKKGIRKYYLAMPIPIKYDRGMMDVMAMVNLVTEVKYLWPWSA